VICVGAGLVPARFWVIQEGALRWATTRDCPYSGARCAMSDLPDGWVETEFGQLPENWQPIEAQIFCEKVADGTHDSPKQRESGKLLITSKNIKNSRLDVASAYHISSDDFDEVNRRSKVDQWDVLLSMIGTVGEVCLIDSEPDFAIKNVGLFKCANCYVFPCLRTTKL